MDIKDLNIGFIGAGRMAGVLSRALSKGGYHIVAFASRNPSSAISLAATVPGSCALDTVAGLTMTANFVFITTPDAAVPYLARELPWRPGQFVVHTCGGYGADILTAARHRGAVVGAFHPLQTIVASADPDVFNGVTFALEAREPLFAVLCKMVTDLGGRSISLKAEDRALYHAGAVMVSNYLVTLVNVATGLWQDFATEPEAIQAFLPLVRTTLSNVEAIGTSQSLTGPIARGDGVTIARHIQALEDRRPEALSLYAALGQETLKLAESQGRIEPSQIDHLKKILGTLC